MDSIYQTKTPESVPLGRRQNPNGLHLSNENPRIINKSSFGIFYRVPFHAFEFDKVKYGPQLYKAMNL